MEIAEQQGFGVAVGAEARSFSLELAAQVPKIVDLSVEDERRAPRRVGHRLIGALAWVHDGEAPEHQRPAGLGCNPT